MEKLLLKTVSDHVKQEVCYRNMRYLQRLLWEDRRQHKVMRQLHQLQDQGDEARRAQARI